MSFFRCFKMNFMGFNQSRWSKKYFTPGRYRHFSPTKKTASFTNRSSFDPSSIIIIRSIIFAAFSASESSLCFILDPSSKVIIRVRTDSSIISDPFIRKFRIRSRRKSTTRPMPELQKITTSLHFLHQFFLHQFCTPKFLNCYTKIFELLHQNFWIVTPKFLNCYTKIFEFLHQFYYNKFFTFLHQFFYNKFFTFLHQNFWIFTPICFKPYFLLFYTNFFYTRFFYFFTSIYFYTKKFSFFLHQYFCFFTPKFLFFFTKFWNLENDFLEKSGVKKLM